MLNKIASVLVILAGLWCLHEYDKHEAVKEAVAVTKVVMNKEYQDKLKVAEKAAITSTEAIQASADKLRNNKDEIIHSISNQLNSALNELRLRPKRPTSTDSPKDSPSVEACTARELYQEDAEFLTREAARSETVLVERDYYYKQYEEVREKINGLTK